MFEQDFLDRINRALPMTDFLERSRSGDYCCPFCGSGHGPKRTGALHYYPDTNTAACFAGCVEGAEEGHYYDLIAVVEKVEGLDGFLETVKYIAGRAGIPLPDDDVPPGGWGHGFQKREKTEDLIIGPPAPKPNTPGKYERLITNAVANVDGARDYLHSRGISDGVIEKYKIGCSTKYFAGAGKELPCVVFPYSRNYSYYSLRSLEGKHFYKPPEKEAGSEPLYNPRALFEDKPCFVVESILDALAIITAGGNAVAINGTGWGKLKNFILAEREKNKKWNPRAPLVLSLDNDKPDDEGGRPGQDAQRQLAEELKNIRVPYIEAAYTLDKYAGDRKDANDLLRANPGQLAEDVGTNEGRAMDPTGIEDFLYWTQTRKYEPIKTGFEELDNCLRGGLVAKTLCVISGGAGSGKTLLACMIAENLATAGRRVVYYNFEMARDQLFARTISRRIYESEQNITLTATDILQGYKLTDRERANVRRAARQYQQDTAGRLEYNPPDMSADLTALLSSLDKLGDAAEQRGEPGAIVVVDYIHLLSGDKGEDTAATIRRAVMGLKRYAINYNTIAIAISAQSRMASNATEARQDAGRDTSNIEYSADIILQFYKPDEKNRKKNNQVNLAITKSRFSEMYMTGIPYEVRGNVSLITPI